MSTHISWATEVWNPTVGCTRVSEGCRNCYAEREAHRMGGNPNPRMHAAYSGLTHIVNGRPAWTNVVRCLPERLAIPLRWRKPRRVFVDSMSDLFHADVPDEFIARVFVVMAIACHHRYMILTKRPERMADFMSDPRWRRDGWEWALSEVETRGGVPGWETLADCYPPPDWPPPSVWLGISAENQETLDERLPWLLKTPAAHRFLSLEPLLGPMSLAAWDSGRCGCEVCATTAVRCPASRFPIDLVIAGGESGPGARPCDLDWLRSLRDQCLEAGCDFHLKQLGSRWAHQERWLREGEVRPSARPRSLAGADPSEWPEDLRGCRDE